MGLDKYILWTGHPYIWVKHEEKNNLNSFENEFKTNVCMCLEEILQHGSNQYVKKRSIMVFFLWSDTARTRQHTRP